MSTVETTPTPDTFADCGTGDGGALPADPFTALRFHFGMLLGVDDFEVEQGFHHGKQRLHNAWLHRDGVVWGFGVEVAEDEVRVLPGLALDAAGRELHLDDPACVSVAAWYAEHTGEVGGPGADGNVEFDAYVIARYATCPMRPVPALAEPCSGSTSDTAYSRTYETVDLRLVAGPLPDPPPEQYHRLRVLFGLDAATLPADKAAADARAAALAAADRPAALLAALGDLAVLDALDVKPWAEADEPATRYPAADDTGVVLARITGLTLTPDPGGGWTVSGGTVDYTGRRTLLPTQLIQELLCGPEGSGGGAAFDPAQVAFDTGAGTVTLVATAPLDPDTITPTQFAVTTLDGGWKPQKVKSAALDGAGTTVTLTLDALPAGKTIRVLAYGTGPTPILGADLTPLGGGADFVLMKGS
jgi:hypothetical protein